MTAALTLSTSELLVLLGSLAVEAGDETELAGMLLDRSSAPLAEDVRAAVIDGLRARGLYDVRPTAAVGRLLRCLRRPELAVRADAQAVDPAHPRRTCVAAVASGGCTGLEAVAPRLISLVEVRPRDLAAWLTSSLRPVAGTSVVIQAAARVDESALVVADTLICRLSNEPVPGALAASVDRLVAGVLQHAGTVGRR